MLRVKNKPQLVAAVEADLIKQVRARGRISRVELARELKIAPSTASIYVDRLAREGFLLGSQTTKRCFGRPPTLLTLNPEAGRFVGVDFEARNIMATAVDFSEKPLRQMHVTIRTTDSVDQILRRIEHAVAEVIADDPRPVLGIGVGVPGVIDPAAGVARHYDFIRGWHNIPLGASLRGKFGAPVFLENNIRAMALAELWFGQGRGLQDFVCVGVRSGIAAGIVANGELLRGAGNQAGEIGHWSCPVPMALAAESRRGAGEKRDRPSQAAGAAGEEAPWLWQPGARLEHVASLSAALEAAQKALNRGQKTSLARVRGELSLDDLLAEVRAGDPYANSLLAALARVHGWVASQLNALFNPQKIIFAGPLTELGELFLAPLRESASQLGFGRCGGPTAANDLETVITGSTFGKYNGALGAAALALHQWKPKR